MAWYVYSLASKEWGFGFLKSKAQIRFTFLKWELVIYVKDKS